MQRRARRGGAALCTERCCFSKNIKKMSKDAEFCCVALSSLPAVLYEFFWNNCSTLVYEWGCVVRFCYNDDDVVLNEKIIIIISDVMWCDVMDFQYYYFYAVKKNIFWIPIDFWIPCFGFLIIGRMRDRAHIPNSILLSKTLATFVGTYIGMYGMSDQSHFLF